MACCVSTSIASAMGAAAPAMLLTSQACSMYGKGVVACAHAFCLVKVVGSLLNAAQFSRLFRFVMRTLLRYVMLFCCRQF